MSETLYLIRGSEGQTRRIAATVFRRGDGQISWSTESEQLIPLLARLLGRDFDEHFGFPTRRFRASRGSIEAFNLAAQYLSATMGFGAVTSRIETLEASPKPPRLSRVDSLSVMNAIAAVHTVKIERLLAEQIKIRQEALDYRHREAVRFGSTFEFFRQHRSRPKSAFSVGATRARTGDWYRVAAMRSRGSAAAERTDQLSDGFLLSRSGPVGEVRANAA